MQVSCQTNFYYSTWNWGTLTTYGDTSALAATQTSASCVPCPIGCTTCEEIANPGTCLNVNCLTCGNSFTIDIYTKSGCPNRNYCKCKLSGQYPQFNQTNCRACSALITACTTCAPHTWAGTYCAQCNLGYYPAPGNLPRSCIGCPAGCTACSSATVCTGCSGILVMIGGVCICDPTQNLFYSSGTCVICSSAITNCATCLATGLLTTCTACISGFYPSSTTCVPCNTYCLTCTSTLCTLCSSSTFIVAGQSCVCNNTGQMFFDNTTSTCLTCSAFIADCQTCDNTTGTLTCLLCDPGFYFDGTACVACVSLCVNCTTGTNCFACQTTFITDGSTCFCDSANNFILDAGTGTCVLCQFLIANCLTCV